MKKEIKKEMSKEKKKTLIITISLAVIALVLMLCFIFMELREMGIIGSSESNEIMKEFNYNYNSDERKVIYYSSSECGYCKMQTPILELIAEDYDLEYCSIDSTKLSKKQANIVLEKLGIENATPTTVIVEDGKVVDVQEGYVDGRELVEFFKENKILEEDAVYSAEKYITYVDYNKYRSLTRSEETSIIVIGQSTCSHCIAIKPALNSVAEDYNLTINYLNLTELNEDETNKFYESLEDIEYNDPDFVKDGSFGTPLTMVVEDGKIVDYISGSRTISQLVRKFRQLGLIEE
jgi:predicted bacteriocin transport accessory protein